MSQVSRISGLEVLVRRPPLLRPSAFDQSELENGCDTFVPARMGGRAKGPALGQLRFVMSAYARGSLVKTHGLPGHIGRQKQSCYSLSSLPGESAVPYRSEMQTGFCDKSQESAECRERFPVYGAAKFCRVIFRATAASASGSILKVVLS